MQPVLNLSGIQNVLQQIGNNINLLNNTLTTLLPNGAYLPISLADSAAPLGSLYYSTTASKLAFKDFSGVVHTLY